METEKLNKIANKIRQLIIISLVHAKSGHPAGALGLADIFSFLYFKYLNINKNNYKLNNRDILILSNGHTCPVLYATLALKNFFDLKLLTTLRSIDSKLQGHPHFQMLPGIENTGGPLGQGISQSIGRAIANPNVKVVCIISDGELQEGQTWEALMFIGNSSLKNLTVIIDRNNIQISGFVESTMPVEPLQQKLQSFNLVTFDTDGNNINDLIDVFNKRDLVEKPAVIIANTVPGMGVSFMENNYEWHGKTISKEEAKIALGQLKG